MNLNKDSGDSSLRILYIGILRCLPLVNYEPVLDNLIAFCMQDAPYCAQKHESISPQLMLELQGIKYRNLLALSRSVTTFTTDSCWSRPVAGIYPFDGTASSDNSVPLLLCTSSPLNQLR